MIRPSPRVRLLEPDNWPANMQKMADGKLGALNVMKALMHQPDLFRRWSIFANHFLFKSTLPARTREMLILRVAWRTDCEYEWSQHLKMSAACCGFGPKEFGAIIHGPATTFWTNEEQTLLRVVDAIVEGPAVTDRLWEKLTDHWSTSEILDILAMIGNYVMLAMALNTLRIPPDPGYPEFNERTPPRSKPNIQFLSPAQPQGEARVLPSTGAHLSLKESELLVKARGPFESVNVIDTLAHNMDLLRRWLPFFNHCLHKQTLDPRARELMILRTGWLAGSSYEWSQHVPIALRRDVKPAEINAIPDGPFHEQWNGADRALLEAVDGLMTNFTMTDTEWQRVARNLMPSAILDLIFTVGQYRLVAGLLRGFNVQLDSYLRFPPAVD